MSSPASWAAREAQVIWRRPGANTRDYFPGAAMNQAQRDGIAFIAASVIVGTILGVLVELLRGGRETRDG